MFDFAPHFSYQNKNLCVEQVLLATLAKQFGTPLYVYSKAGLVENFKAYSDACDLYGFPNCPPSICYSVKSNSSLGVLSVLAHQGSYFDIVSGGELSRVLAAGGDRNKIVFSGVGKTTGELKHALANDILCINVESVSELRRLNEIAGEMGKKAPVAIRVNPDVDAKTDAHISTGLKENKFGIAHEEAEAAYQLAASLPYIAVKGVSCHIGSQIKDDAPLLDALDRLMDMTDKLTRAGFNIEHIDIGGGIGVNYNKEPVVPVRDYMSRLLGKVSEWRQRSYAGIPIKVMLEPGRSIVANTGVLLTEIQYLKTGGVKNFAIIDAAMNDLMRPALYDSFHQVLPVVERDIAAKTFDVVGPVCESTDCLARARELAIREGDVLAIMTAGAYGMAMASNYNSRARAAEVMVDGTDSYLIRRRETADDLFASETVPEGLKKDSSPSPKVKGCNL